MSIIFWWWGRSIPGGLDTPLFNFFSKINLGEKFFTIFTRVGRNPPGEKILGEEKKKAGKGPLGENGDKLLKLSLVKKNSPFSPRPKR